ncbi:hypothetical protein BDV95DRAFT_603530 [Massariosphaeria phaeospora]|uniref:F-box domain-containing protein n=1 Tax=Massariosphaeria phaeospora TaxID=100035 RepID=A0A7C8IAJ5_9PLEO|nr:hypothetical protein BDV95DRAFT_603530 [Massariosphaeria phaeospora]
MSIEASYNLQQMMKARIRALTRPATPRRPEPSFAILCKPDYLPQQPRPKAGSPRQPLQETPFEKLPDTLLPTVLRLLPLSDVASLALTSRTLFRRVIRVANPFLAIRRRGNEFERAKFLVNFAEHHPKETICYKCGFYHPRWASITPYHETKKGIKRQFVCVRAVETFPQAISAYTQTLSWTDFHNLMLDKCYPSQHVKPRNFLSRIFYFNKKGWVYDREAIFTNNRLLYRDRDYRGVPTGTPLNGGFGGFRSFCPHSRDVPYRNYVRVMDTGVELIPRLTRNGFANGFAFKTHRCPECPTELRFEIWPRARFPGKVYSGGMDSYP